ncbi:hypothetical protein [Streptomyces sp. NPDC001820]
MAVRIGLTLDCTDAQLLATFWKQAGSRRWGTSTSHRPRHEFCVAAGPAR